MKTVGIVLFIFMVVFSVTGYCTEYLPWIPRCESSAFPSSTGARGIESTSNGFRWHEAGQDQSSEVISSKPRLLRSVSDDPFVQDNPGLLPRQPNIRLGD